ncbi:MAG: hypothetical protein ACPGU0_06105 [Marinirhabdus sp.]
MSIIINEENKGYINIEDGFSSMYTIEVCDYLDNKILITIPIEGMHAEITPARVPGPGLELARAGQGTKIEKGKFEIYIPPGALYEDAHLAIRARGDTLHFHKDEIPIHKNITLKIDAANYKRADLEKLYIGRLNYKGLPYYTPTTRNGSVLTARTRSFGSYTVVADTAPPKIRPLNFTSGKWISKNKTLKIKIEDAHSGISSYRATLNGQYILTEYDYKRNTLTYYFEDAVSTQTENNLKVIVTDNVGNSATYGASFFRKQP